MKSCKKFLIHLSLILCIEVWPTVAEVLYRSNGSFPSREKSSISKIDEYSKSHAVQVDSNAQTEKEITPNLLGHYSHGLIGDNNNYKVMEPHRTLNEDVQNSGNFEPQIVHYHIIPSDISKLYLYNVSKFEEYLFEYAYNSSELEHRALRVTISSPAATFSMPVMVVVRQQRGALSWQLPLPPPPNTMQLKDYKTVSRTLCPVKNFNFCSNDISRHDCSHLAKMQSSTNSEHNLNAIQRLSIDVSTQSEIALPFYMTTEYFMKFDLKMDTVADIAATPSTPVFLQFTFPEAVDTVLVYATSNSTFCAAMAVQRKKCPVWDQEETISYAAYYQTMSQQAAITLTKAEFTDGFYVTLVTLSNDISCSGDFQNIDTNRDKLFKIIVKEKITHPEFALGVLTGILFCAVIYILVIIRWCCERKSDAHLLQRLGPSHLPSPTISRRRVPRVKRCCPPPSALTSSTRSLSSVAKAGVSSSALESDGPPTVLLSDGGVFDDQAELQREMDTAMAALQRDVPTLATDVDQLEVIHDSDSSVDGIAVQVISEEDEDGYTGEMEADSAEGYDTSCYDTRSRADEYGRQRPPDASMLDQASVGGPSFVTVGGGGGRRVSHDSDDEQSSSRPPTLQRAAGTKARLSSIRPRRTLYLQELTRKRSHVLKRRSVRYITSLITASIFYFVPVLQLVSTYQKVLNVTGNQDLCYYNFLCSNPFGLLSDFNHVFSNVGYVGLGLLFGLVTYMKQRRFNEQLEREPQVEKLGIPHDFGLYYALAFSLVMEGMLSAAYHVCPNNANFQFDTAFMYVIAALLVLKLYQQRHYDITASADTVFLGLAAAVLFGVIGVISGSTWVWVCTAMAHAFMCALMTAHVYYVGRWSLVSTVRSVYRNGGARYLLAWMKLELSNWRDWRQLRSQFGTRVGLLVLGNIANWAFLLLGAIRKPTDYDTFLLGIFVLNLMLYVAFYLLMKTGYGEHLGVGVRVSLLLLVVTWPSALFVFFLRPTDWAQSPARSRDLNKPCIIFNFYDWHDVWHFLSSLALFNSYYLIMIVDDDLQYTPRDMIAVF